jgi:O6-methylguanine-DNA--protein-cysteine methyltransferase
MDGTSASLERIKALWQQLERATPGSPEYDAIAKQIRTESDAYNALIEAAKKNPPAKRED